MNYTNYYKWKWICYGMSEENPYQVAVELKEPLMKDEGRPYKAFLGAVDTSNPHATGMPGTASIGEYDSDTHVFYGLADKDSAEKFAGKARRLAGVKSVHLDEFVVTKT